MQKLKKDAHESNQLYIFEMFRSGQGMKWAAVPSAIYKFMQPTTSSLPAETPANFLSVDAVMKNCKKQFWTFSFLI